MNRAAFEEKIRGVLGEFQVEQGLDQFSYFIVNARDVRYQNNQFSIEDRGWSGIQIDFYDSYRGKQQRVEHIYHWSEAYELLFLGLLNPEKLIFQDETYTSIDIFATLGAEKPDFTWNPTDSLTNFSFRDLIRALKMVKNGLVLSLTSFQSEDENKIIRILIKNLLCEKNVSQEMVDERVEQAFETNLTVEETGTYQLDFYDEIYLFQKCDEPKCDGDFCMEGLCGYLEYLAKCGILYDTLHQREDMQVEVEFEDLFEEMEEEKKEYSFSWNPDGGVRYMEENQYHLAEMMTQMVQIEQAQQKVKIRIHGPLLCILDEKNFGNDIVDQEMTTTYLAGKAECWERDGTVVETCLSLTDSLMTPLATTITNTKEQIIPESFLYHVAAYIKYMKSQGREAELRADRQYFREHPQEVKRMKEPFGNMDELPLNLYLEEPEEYFEIADLLQENNYVSLYQSKREYEGTLRYWIRTVMPVGNWDGSLEQLKMQLSDQCLERTKSFYYWIEEMGNDDERKVLHIVAIAGYLDYLKRTGQYVDYREKLNRTRQENEEQFTKLKESIPKLEAVVDVVDSMDESSLYSIIQGERGVGKRRIIQQIAKLLFQKGKTDSAEYECLTFNKLATELTDRKYLQNRDNFVENSYADYTIFKKKKLYVLTDLKEFLYASKVAKDGDDTKETHLLKVLGRYQPETYIIIVGEKRYVEQFLDLSPQIKFIYENNIIPIENLTAKRIYELFCEKLTENLQSQLQNEPDFRQEFLRYLAQNSRYMPLANQELADYLANYANKRKNLEFPPDIYCKRSAKEMLDSVVGMENVKRIVSDFERYATFVKQAEMEGMDLPNSNLHMLFTGNPGTGKTMIARIVGQMLYDLGLIEKNEVTEVEARDLKTPYSGESAVKTGEVITKAMGGVLFIDEAYSIGEDAPGKEIIATLIKAMEDHKDKFVVILAGYEREMQDFMNINSGIASRIGYKVHFEDYSVEELVLMFMQKMKKAGFELESTAEIQQKITEICGHFAAQKNFGNGRFVDKIIQRTITRHAVNAAENGSIKLLATTDIPDLVEFVSTDIVQQTDYRQQLEEFIGMSAIKEKVRQFAAYVEFVKKAKEQGHHIPAGNLHMIFTGNPGTGKTTIARIMKDMLYSIGIIHENKLIEVERKDLVAEYIGQTAVKTAKVIESALEGVLFIDEAYSLAPKDSARDFGAEAVATLIKAMEDHKDNLIVIFAGYKDEMRQFLNLNPGIASRIGSTFDFEDYSTEELMVMYQKNMEKSGFTLSEDALGEAKNVVEYFKRKKNFGNGRFVARLQQETTMKHSVKVANEDAELMAIEATDIPDITEMLNQPKVAELTTDLDQIIGLSQVKQKLQEFEAIVNFRIQAREHGLTIPAANLHMLFSGNPGTGKTTVARLIAKKLYEIGIIMENKVVEVERKDLVSSHVGETAQKTADKIEAAMGGILFVDEAYSLISGGSNDFGKEAIDTMIKAMEDHKDDLLIIFAGYEKEMKAFVDSNPGIQSRIGFQFHFEDYSTEELAQMYRMKLEKNGFRVAMEAMEKVKGIIGGYERGANFGNGRFVDQLIQRTLTKHAMQFTMEEIDLITEKDIPKME